MNELLMSLVDHWLMNLMDLLLVDDWLMVLMNDLLVVLMHKVLMMLMHHVLMMLVDNISVEFLHDWGSYVALNAGREGLTVDDSLAPFLLDDGWLLVPNDCGLHEILGDHRNSSRSLSTEGLLEGNLLLRRLPRGGLSHGLWHLGLLGSGCGRGFVEFLLLLHLNLELKI